MSFEVYRKGKKIKGKMEADFLHEEIGIFESLRTYGNHIFRMGEHLSRFMESVKTSGYKPVPSKLELENELIGALKAFRRSQAEHLGREMEEDLFLRLSHWNGKSFVLVGERRHPGNLYREGIQLQTSPVKRTYGNAMPPQVKTSAYHNAVLATLEQPAENSYEWLFLDAEGYVTEVRTGNIFMVRDGKIFTPPLTGILNGVTRRVVIECAVRARISCRETCLTRHDVYNADEAFLTNTSWEILPIAALDKRVIGNQVPGAVTQKLQKIFKTIIREECS